MFVNWLSEGPTVKLFNNWLIFASYHWGIIECGDMGEEEHMFTWLFVACNKTWLGYLFTSRSASAGISTIQLKMH